MLQTITLQTNIQHPSTSYPTPHTQQYVQEGKGKPSDNKGYYDKGYKGEAKGKAKGDDKGKATPARVEMTEDIRRTMQEADRYWQRPEPKAQPTPKGAPGVAKGDAKGGTKGKRARWTCSSCGKYNTTDGEWTNECHCTAEAKATGKGKSSAKDGKSQSTEWQNDDEGHSKGKNEKGKTIDEKGDAHRYIPDATGNLIYTRVYHAHVPRASGRPQFDRDVRLYLRGNEENLA